MPFESGAILIFVPGIAEIRDITTLLKNNRQLCELSSDSNNNGNKGSIKANKSLKILPLHSTLSSTEQSRVFEVYPSNVVKIVVSTNIAETSVTIPDVVYVIDTVKVKENRYDEVRYK